MGEDINNVISKLQSSEKYRALFARAYGNDTVSSEKILKSMAQFMGLMLSNKSKYDRYKNGEATLSDEELQGYSLFVQKCSGCHTEPLFTDFKYRNNGLAIDPVFKDGGRGHLKPEEPQFLYCFKTPSLRNVALTQPYMHDGRYQTLEQCLDHYTNNIVNKVNLDPALKNGIAMSADDKKKIIVFLNTLTDHKFISDARFKDPNF
jgi:cytochrome c peroxidase